MLGKLIKHDFKSLARILVPTIIAILGATLLASLGISFNIRSGYASFSNSDFVGIIKTITTLFIIISVMAIFAAFFFIIFIIFQRFYKNFMTDEGYLTFTLPVKTSELLWSKLITAVIWTAISFVVGILCLFIFGLFGTSSTSFINPDIFKAVGEFFRAIGETFTTGTVVIIIETILFILALSVQSILHVYLALIIGGVVAQKRKLLAGIGFYFIINMVVGIFSTIIQFAIMNPLFRSFNSLQYNYTGDAKEAINVFVREMQPYYWTYMIMFVALAVAYFLISHYLLKNKLNLE